MHRRLLATLVIVAAIGMPGGAKQSAQRADQAAQTTVSAILVDVVVRDRRGQPVAGLTAEDFEITEDGVPQTLGSVTPIFKAVRWWAGLKSRPHLLQSRPPLPPHRKSLKSSRWSSTASPPTAAPSRTRRR
jgi:hypothetical protein